MHEETTESIQNAAQVIEGAAVHNKPLEPDNSHNGTDMVGLTNQRVNYPRLVNNRNK